LTETQEETQKDTENHTQKDRGTWDIYRERQKNKGTLREMEIHCEIMGETDKHRERERGRETENDVTMRKMKLFLKMVYDSSILSS